MPTIGNYQELKENALYMAILVWAGLGLAFFLFVQDLSAEPNTREIKLAWDPSSSANVAGYMVYYKCCIPGPPYEGTEAYQGDSPVIIYLEDLQDPDNPQFELSGLSKQNEYYFAVTAFDQQSNESDFSEEASTAETDSGDGPYGADDRRGGGSGGGCFIRSAAPFACVR